MKPDVKSYSVGGQILISDSVWKRVGNILRIDEQREVIPKGAEMEMEHPLDLLTNIKMNLRDVPEDLAARDFYGKVVETAGEAPNRYRIRFTSPSPEIAAYFQALRQYGGSRNH